MSRWLPNFAQALTPLLSDRLCNMSPARLPLAAILVYHHYKWLMPLRLLHLCHRKVLSAMQNLCKLSFAVCSAREFNAPSYPLKLSRNDALSTNRNTTYCAIVSACILCVAVDAFCALWCVCVCPNKRLCMLLINQHCETHAAHLVHTPISTCSTCLRLTNIWMMH